MAVNLDTDQLVKELTAAGFTEVQAEAVTRAVAVARDLDLSHLATEAGMEQRFLLQQRDFEAKFDALRTDVDMKIEAFRKDVDTKIEAFRKEVDAKLEAGRSRSSCASRTCVRSWSGTRTGGATRSPSTRSSTPR